MKEREREERARKQTEREEESREQERSLEGATKYREIKKKSERGRERNAWEWGNCVVF